MSQPVEVLLRSSLWKPRSGMEERVQRVLDAPKLRAKREYELLCRWMPMDAPMGCERLEDYADEERSKS